MTFAETIEYEAKGEAIEAIVIGKYGWGGYGEDETRPEPKRNEVLSWEEARPSLDYHYDAGYGAPECDAIYAWTPKRVIFISQYDGATGTESLPRSPEPCEPDMPGG